MQLLDLKKDILLIIKEIKDMGVPVRNIEEWQNDMLYYNSILDAYKTLIEVCKFQSDWLNDGDISGGV